ncbi:MAG: NADH-quinone oxidoreductase subunit NuoH [candidate division Zixibacteria bacterium]|nr:NADH-quinone oxidoreductase subunit NuoH [candidate division Zixibacteria bacterium]
MNGIIAFGELHGVFAWLYDLLVSTGLPQPWLDIVRYTALGAMMFGVLSLIALFLVWWERKIAGHIQQRFGPMRNGWHGWYQTIVDAVKLLQKEDILVVARDKMVFFWAPVLCFLVAFLAYVTIPFGEGLIVADLNVGILYIMAVTTFTAISLLMAGWGSNNKYALLGGMRSAAQAVSYEVPMVASILVIVVFVGSLSMVDIVNAQSGFLYNWFIFKVPFGPIAFVTYIIAATAEANRTPFDIPEAEQELVAGYNVEYSGMKFAMFFLAEFINGFTVSAIAVTLFLGGWHGPLNGSFLPSWVWFFLKTFGIVFLLMMFRWTYPRLRVDQLMGFAWKFLVPVTFANLILGAIIKYAGWYW